jgi:AcrR family transcriptional regulator
MPADRALAETPRRRGPRPRHSRQEVAAVAVAIADAEGIDAVTIRAVAARLGASAMSLYSYVPDKQALIHEMVEHVGGEHGLPSQPSGNWRADLHLMARQQRAVLIRHPWLINALSHRQPLGPATLGYLEFALGALEPTGLDAGSRLETIALVNGFVTNLVRAEIADSELSSPDPAEAALRGAQVQELLATGRYPRFAAAIQHADASPVDLAAQFERLLDRLLDGLIPRQPGRRKGRPAT